MPNPSSSRRALIIGGGLTGCTVAHELAEHGWHVRIHESSELAGGLVRSATLGGVVYEPHGSHIFHTEDREVWDYVQRFVPFNDYRHRVDIMIEGKVLNWPMLVSDIDEQSDSERIRAELAEREGVDAGARAASANFEEWCLESMGPTLYERYIYPYTKKQWGREPRLLSATWAPRRVQLRRDNDPYLFPDPYQGRPNGKEGYTDLIEGLIAHPSIELVTNSTLDLESTPAAAAEHDSDLVVLTCPLDIYAGSPMGELSGAGSGFRAYTSRTRSTRRARWSSTTRRSTTRSSACTRPSTRRGSNAEAPCSASSSRAPRPATTRFRCPRTSN